jgi:hypothetical protein
MMPSNDHDMNKSIVVSGSISSVVWHGLQPLANSFGLGTVIIHQTLLGYLFQQRDCEESLVVGAPQSPPLAMMFIRQLFLALSMFCGVECGNTIVRPWF